MMAIVMTIWIIGALGFAGWLMRGVLPHRHTLASPQLRAAAKRCIYPCMEAKMQIDRDSAGVRFPPPLAFLGTLLIGWAIGKFLGKPGVPLHNWYMMRTLGWVVVFAGFAIMLTAFGLFRKAGTHHMPWKATTSFVTDGVYRWTRNPMYLGMALIYGGIAFVLNSFVALILLVPLLFMIQREVIAREEAYMEAKFGDRYRDYKASVRRWI
jgi:protein-S-isoprenylcysteine O-methyltransferase Ste14